MKINACSVTISIWNTGPAKVQRQLPDTEHRDQDENKLAGKHVAEQSQRQ